MILATFRSTRVQPARTHLADRAVRSGQSRTSLIPARARLRLPTVPTTPTSNWTRAARPPPNTAPTSPSRRLPQTRPQRGGHRYPSGLRCNPATARRMAAALHRPATARSEPTDPNAQAILVVADIAARDCRVDSTFRGGPVEAAPPPAGADHLRREAESPRRQHALPRSVG